jgi:hypothetical protein
LVLYDIFHFKSETSYCAHIGGQHGGFDAFGFRKVKRGDAGKLGPYAIISVLPDKFASFLYEFHDFRFESHDLPQLVPPLPADRSDFDVHGALGDAQVPRRLISIELIVCVDYMYYSYFCYYSY